MSNIPLHCNVITLLRPKVPNENRIDDGPRAKRDGHGEYNLEGAGVRIPDCSGETADNLHRHAGDVHKVPPDHWVRAPRIAGIGDGLIILTTDVAAAAAT